ncbi:hypothetical protein GGX14DRAFT_352923 [Mycena pura]|uniref:Zn(2)-C6 fungal-type domain-containing protein n=1 Tax=Mycena pura TaxID=153505 RepID=A0AAD6VTC5_9AGAR|nr:hypothetical protein GGX14DRAFT_352923 [Mycena pura]
MTDLKDETGSVGEVSDDGRATSTNNGPGNADSAWTSRRGKARCDSCRLRNLKCDRILPMCNQCRWTPPGTNCTYTPLPTPAHRGVPRCDRCRESNLKCDRAAPVCQYCRESNITDCRYTPKKRARPPLDNHTTTRIPYNTQAQSASFMFTNISGPVESQPYNRPFVNEGISSASRSDVHSRTVDVDRSSNPYSTKNAFSEGPPLALLPAPPPQSTFTNQQPFISHSFPDPVRNQHITPWSHPSFLPLPEHILRRVSGLNSSEMPSRESFDRALADFAEKLGPDLRETALFPPEAYATLANCLARGNVSRLSPRIRAWSTCHRLCSGSDKLNLIVAPRDAVFQTSAEDEQRMIKDYRASLDGQAKTGASSSTQRSDKDVVLGADTAFERLPVEPQIYDCLAYAHRGHASSVAVLMEIRRLGIASITWPMAEIFITLCPLCTKTGSTLATKSAVNAGSSASR